MPCATWRASIRVSLAAITSVTLGSCGYTSGPLELDGCLRDANVMVRYRNLADYNKVLVAGINVAGEIKCYMGANSNWHLEFSEPWKRCESQNITCKLLANNNLEFYNTGFFGKPLATATKEHEKDYALQNDANGVRNVANPVQNPINSPMAKASKNDPSADLNLINLSLKQAPIRADDIAVIIGNSNYSRLGRDISDVAPAHADATLANIYATKSLGIRDGNVINLRDATGSQIAQVFGTKDNPRGQLFDWVKPGRSRVFIYYAGHGAPSADGTTAYLVPTDADSARIELNSYPLRTLYDNLGKLPAESVTVVLEACFSGITSSGATLFKSASPVNIQAIAPAIPPNVTVISAGAANQIASWEQDQSHGIFTKQFLLGQSGEADKAPFGNMDGKVSLNELEAYLRENVAYLARRYWGRDQHVQVVRGSKP
jgi:hypothetical protein